MRRSTRYNRPGLTGSAKSATLLGADGDGSTLTLDFTTGILDSRLTFSRLSDATFINSSGFVQYADANHVVNSVLAGAGTGNAPTSWTGSGGINLTIPSAGTRRAETTAAAQNWTACPAFSTQIGVTYSTSVLITSVSGQHYANAFTITGSPTIVGYYRNGSSVAQFGTASDGLITVVWTATTTGNHVARIGIGCTGANVANAVCEFTQPRSVPGTFTQPPYFANTSTTAAYQAPRFDHDPTTLAPRGLLIEGQAVNLARYSETLENTGGFWGYNASTRTVDSADVNPTGGTGSIYFGPTTNGGSRYCGLFLTGQTTTTPYTYSVWLKGKGTADVVISIQSSAGAQNATMTILSQPVGASASVSVTGGGFSKITNLSTTGWTKIQMVLSGNLGGTGTLNVFMYPKETSGQTTADTIYVWGAQLEAGSGASSYIPTGASTATRNADSCVMTGTNFSSWFAGATEGVLYAECERPRKIESPAADHALVGSQYGSGLWIGVTATATNQYPASVLWPTGGFQFAGGIATQIPLLSKQAVRWFNQNDITNFANGTQGGTNTAGTGTVAPAMLTIGANSTSGSAANLDWFNGCVRRVKFWPVALPDSQIISLTT